MGGKTIFVLWQERFVFAAKVVYIAMGKGITILIIIILYLSVIPMETLYFLFTVAF